mgnify:CR=1 FL=1
MALITNHLSLTTNHFFPYLCDALVYCLCSETVIKRESGANPEQSRCCKFRITSRARKATELHLGRRTTTGTSQKTCRYCFNSFRGQSLLDAPT